MSGGSLRPASRGRTDRRRGPGRRAFASAAAALGALAAAASTAQHSTAFDVESGERAYASACANCHGPDGDLIAGIDFGRGLYRRASSDDEIVGIILNGIPNTPMPPNPGMSEAQALAIVAYLRAMARSSASAELDGDAARGRALVEGKGECLTCHRIGRRGSRAGPSLTRIGTARRAEELKRSLLDPAAEVLPENRSYRVVTREGEAITGRLMNHDTFTVQIITSDEKLRSFRKANLAEHAFAETAMPSYRDTLTAQEIADIVSYLVTLRGEERQ